jgi:glycine cleavage system transcriptional repressor
MPKKTNHLIMSALGKDNPGIIDHLSRAIYECECSIQDTRMAVLSGEFAALIAVEGPWDKLARLENQLPELEKELGLAITTDRGEPHEGTSNLLPYVVDLVTLDQPGVVHKVSRFFAEREINIQDMVTSSYAAAHTGTPMFSMRMNVGVPADMHISSLRDEFMDFCDGMNLDAVLEPIKN